METKLFVAGLVLSAANAFGAVYYVATDGNDSNAGSVDSTMYMSAILIQASYLHLKGFEVRNVPMKYNSDVGVYISRSKHMFLE